MNRSDRDGGIEFVRPIHEEVEEVSYTALDVGFDLRVHPKMAIKLPTSKRIRARYLKGKVGDALPRGTRFDVEKVIEGTREEVKKALREAGYIVQELAELEGLVST